MMVDHSQLCVACYMEFAEEEKYCPFCDAPSVAQIPTYFKSKSSNENPTLECISCKFHNDPTNVICVSCDAELFPENKKICEYCGELVKETLWGKHNESCALTSKFLEKESIEMQKLDELAINAYDSINIICKFCSIEVPEDLIKEHNEVCEKQKKIEPIKPIVKPIIKPIVKPIVHYPVKPKPLPGPKPSEVKLIPSNIKLLSKEEFFSEEEISRMTELQLKSIIYMQSKSKEEHIKTEKNVESRAKKLGYKIKDLENLHFYIENYAPIIIHIHITKHMEFFVKDTHYRSQFETNKSSGSLSRSSRISWENRMFDNHYNTAKDCERVKYGVINFTNDPKGVNCAVSYGVSYILLKEHVRNRCTVTDMDSSSTTSLIGTFKYCNHILNKMNDKELESAFKAAKALEESSAVTTTYKEIQIHGSIEFSKDIETLYVNKKEVQDKKYLDMMYEFCEKNKIKYEFI